MVAVNAELKRSCVKTFFFQNWLTLLILVWWLVCETLKITCINYDLMSFPFDSMCDPALL